MSTMKMFYVARVCQENIEGAFAGPFAFWWEASDKAADMSFHEKDNGVDYQVISTVINYKVE